MKTAIYPGSFDPVTNGHMDIIRRASALFDNVVVAVLINSSKSPLFTTEERLSFLREAVRDFPNVSVTSFSGLLSDLVKETEDSVIIRGVRNLTDFESEKTNADLNKALNPDAETVVFFSSPENAVISSSAVKEIASFQGDISGFVPAFLLPKIEEKFQKNP